MPSLCRPTQARSPGALAKSAEKCCPNTASCATLMPVASTTQWRSSRSLLPCCMASLEMLYLESRKKPSSCPATKGTWGL
eukprot:1367908-Lingulodinium_polyedra.AAC.1